MRRLWPLALLLAPLAAKAYIIGAGTVLAKVVSHREEMQLASLVARGTFTFGGDDAKAAAAALKLPEASEVSVPAVLTAKAGGRCRVELAPVGSDVKEVPAAINGGGGATRVVGPGLASLKAVAAYACPLLDPRGDGESLPSFLRALGVDTARVAYGRVGNQVAYVIGGRPRDVGVATFWAGKERFEPLRLLVPGRGGAALDVRLIDYSSPITGEWHPRLVEVRRGADLLGRFAVEKVEPNARVPDALF